MLQERHELNRDGLMQILKNCEKMNQFSGYFRETAQMMQYLNEIYDVPEKSLQQLKKWNEEWYCGIRPEAYGSSYGNPSYCAEKFGLEYGQILSFLYAEMRSGFIDAVEGRLFDLVILNELFLEIYQAFREGSQTPDQLRKIIFDHMRDYSSDVFEYRIREQLDPSLDFAVRIVMESDLKDPDFLYQYGEYISDNERKTLEYLNCLPKEKIQAIAKTYVDGFHEGFIVNNIDMSGKRTVNIRYTIGFEPVIREAIRQFGEIGLSPIIYRSGHSSLTKGVVKVGYVSTSPNPQYDYDHRFDQAVYFDNRFMQHKLECYRNSYERWKEEASVLAGPACMETFGEKPFLPEHKEANLRLSDRQQELSVEFQKKSSEIVNEYIKPDERSFTIIAYPIPEIGDQFEEIFEKVVKVNTLDKDKYREIQQHLIDALDRAVEVHIRGAGENQTDLYVAMHEMEDSQKQTNFENCLADVNIPVGEVFTSPKLAGTNGVLHVGEVYLRDLKFVDLKLVFKDGKIESYTCGNFQEEEENQALIKENILYNRDTLPMGEFAIGTNTTAYAMAKNYDILYQLPILIVEKMGPHFAVGDTCYSHSEDTKVYNPDGKEISAKHNECSIEGEYFQCHTDITIPYEELDSITAIELGGKEIPLIQNGRFVLPGTETLNEPLTEIGQVSTMKR
ncbi:MAG TPA: aminopeptidase [Candidatus Anaerostipes avistercoris]|uniref:Aminopeptidase n=1 Tax=Candidatus Anaerostipes avistercoris TaxID=2838462 RepID=A0A9D2PIW1_9FIRM|nr:aminopeptidase [Candidatus Anaerostipes avistercoris]